MASPGRPPTAQFFPHPFLPHTTQAGGSCSQCNRVDTCHRRNSESPPEGPPWMKSFTFPVQDYHYFLWSTQLAVTPPPSYSVALLETDTLVRMWSNLYFLFIFPNSVSLTRLRRRPAAHADACWISKAQSKSQSPTNFRAQSLGRGQAALMEQGFLRAHGFTWMAAIRVAVLPREAWEGGGQSRQAFPREGAPRDDRPINFNPQILKMYLNLITRR